jgi:hypothetical protein
MNAHTVESIVFLVGFFVVAFSGIGAFTLAESSPPASHSRTIWTPVLVVGIFIGAGALIFGAFALGNPWYSPAPAHSAATELTANLNQTGRPTTPTQVRATLMSSISAINSRKNITLSVVQKEEDRFTVTLSGDTATTCVTYHPNSEHWTWSPRACK